LKPFGQTILWKMFFCLGSFFASSDDFGVDHEVTGFEIGI
jgi:hypothetical protein